MLMDRKKFQTSLDGDINEIKSKFILFLLFRHDEKVLVETSQKKLLSSAFLRQLVNSKKKKI